MSFPLSHVQRERKIEDEEGNIEVGIRNAFEQLKTTD